LRLDASRPCQSRTESIVRWIFGGSRKETHLGVIRVPLKAVTAALAAASVRLEATIYAAALAVCTHGNQFRFDAIRDH
jgi:hypothetical protein